MSTPRLALWLCLLLLGLAGACRCNEPPPTPVDRCKEIPNVEPGRNDPCDAESGCGDHYACKEVKDRGGLMCCQLDDRRCNTEADCCPGQTCPAERKKCFDRFLECDSDEDCGDFGDRTCEEWTDSYGTSKRCMFKTCGALGECPDGLSCFGGECMSQLPCTGTCPSGAACVPANDRCQQYACAVSCEPGYLATFKDNRNIWDSCRLPEVGCACAELPPLRSNDLGRHSALATDPAKLHVYVSHYDGRFGDLVVNRYESDGKLARQDYVDGVPTNAPVKHGPSGARGGVLEPGEDVGRYTDVAVGGNHVYVSYYDVTAGNLKLAIRQSEGAWKRLTVDGASADLGLYTSVGVDSDGLPIIAYFQRGGSDDFDVQSCPGTPKPSGEKKYITALKLARATVANPSSAADFQVLTLGCQSRTAPACTGCQQTCADPGSGPGCYAESDACAACDTNTEVCVQNGATATCAKKYNPSELNELPDGVGLFASLVTQGKDAVVVYMRRTGGKGQLEGIRVNGSGAVSPTVVLDAQGDTGWFPDVKVDPSNNNLAIAYHDFSSRQLKFLYNQNLVAGLTPEVIDSGAGAPGSGDATWVGADVALAFSPSGSLFAAYQDTTRGDLKLSIRTAAWEALQAVRTEGAVGFFTDAAFLNQQLFMSHARLRARTVAGEPQVDNALLLERLAGP
jgi:hypothetical protein